MGRPKGSKNGVDSSQNPSDTAPEEIEQDQEAESKETPSEEVATCNTWRYHEVHEPKIFKEGETIPKGWNNENSRLWYRKTDGIWLKHKK